MKFLTKHLRYVTKASVNGKTTQVLQQLYLTNYDDVALIDNNILYLAELLKNHYLWIDVPMFSLKENTSLKVVSAVKQNSEASKEAKKLAIALQGLIVAFEELVGLNTGFKSDAKDSSRYTEALKVLHSYQLRTPSESSRPLK